MKIASVDLAENYVPESSEIANARHQAERMGLTPIAPAAGAALSFLARSINAGSIVEIGTGTGVSGLYLLENSTATLTSIDLEAEHQHLAKDAFSAAGIAPQRYRLIAGKALEVLPKLTDEAYDLVFIDADKTEFGEYYEEAYRIVRAGGLIVLDHALFHDRVADRSQRDPETVSIRSLLDFVRTDDRVSAVVLPLGDGLLAIRRHPQIPVT